MEMDITVDEGFNVDFISKENNFNITNITGCCVCAEDHETEKCSIFDNLIHISDTKVLPRALLTLPPKLKVETLADGTNTVISQEHFYKGTQFGPYQAEKFYSLNPFDNFPIKVFGNSENNIPNCYLDSRNKEKSNWMCYIPPANNYEEQNLICYQIKSDIFFSVIRDIEPGDHLKVWYSSYYATKIGSEILTPQVQINEAELKENIIETLPAKKLGAIERENWCCKMCSHIEISVVKFAKHLQIHYSKIIKNFFTCNVCNKGFSTEKTLNLHRKYDHIVLTNNKPNDVHNFVNGKPSETPKNNVTDCSLPLPPPVDNSLTDTDQLLDQLGLSNELNDAETLRALLCDDNTKASKTAQERSIADFSLEFVESNETLPKLQPPYYCDICNKEFKDLRNLRRHLKKHAGEYTCVHCLRVFSRKENYLRHPCYTADIENKFNCSFCNKIFYQKKYFERHMLGHNMKYECDKCKRKYKSKYGKDHHNCSAIPNSQKPVYTCNFCDKTFNLKHYLQRHIKNFHEERRKNEINPLICEICAKPYQFTNSLKMHMRTHDEAKYTCNTCDKKFYRQDTYRHHLKVHEGFSLICDICNKSFSTKKTLREHKLLHSGTKLTCNECGKNYATKRNLVIHQKKTHTENPVSCPDCGKKFKNNFLLIEHRKTNHTSKTFSCYLCSKTYSLSRLLDRHMKLYHTGKTFLCQYCQKKYPTIYLLRHHMKKQHLELKEQWDKPGVLENMQNIDQSLEENITNFEEATDNFDRSEEVLLSIPKVNKEIGKNVYIMENGRVEISNSKEISREISIEEKEVILSVPETEQNLVETSRILEDIENTSISNLQIGDPKENDLPASDDLILLSNAEPISLVAVPLNNTAESNFAEENPDQFLISMANTPTPVNLERNAIIFPNNVVQPQQQGNLMIYFLNPVKK